MALRIDDTTAAYGLFHVAYAALDQVITNSLVSLRRSPDEQVENRLAWVPLSKRLKLLEDVAKPLDQSCDYVQHFSEALALAKEVQAWRNSCVHARVEFLDGIRPVLLNREDGKPVQLDAATCEEKIRQSIKAQVELDAYIGMIVARAEFLDEAQELGERIEAGSEHD
jgi:hypothetical protein